MTAGSVLERGITHPCSLGCWRSAPDHGTAIHRHDSQEGDRPRYGGAMRLGGFAVTFARGWT